MATGLAAANKVIRVRNPAHEVEIKKPEALPEELYFVAALHVAPAAYAAKGLSMMEGREPMMPEADRTATNR